VAVGNRIIKNPNSRSKESKRGRGRKEHSATVIISTKYK